MAQIIAAAILSVGSYTFTLKVNNLTLAYVLHGLYFTGLNYSLYAVLKFEYVLNNEHFNIKRPNVTRVIYQSLLFLDIIIQLTNVFTHWGYILEPYYIEGAIHGWTITFKAMFHAHLLICYVVAFIIVRKFIVDLLRTAKYYKTNYILVLVLFLIELILNAIFIANSNLIKIDYSLFGYAFFSIVTFTFSLYLVPKNLQKNILSTASYSIRDAVLCFDNKGNCIYKNIQGQKILENVDKDWMQKYFNQREDVVTQPETIVINGEPHIFSLEFRRVRDKKQKYSGCYYKLSDRTEALKNIEKEEYRTKHDELTGLYNRTYFFLEMERILKEEPSIPRYLITTDIKDFKLVNDLFGSKFGDNILIFQANMLRYADYPDCIIGRISGDHFAMLIRKSDFKMDLALKNSERIKDFSKDINFQLGISLGLYEIANPYENVHSMYDKANLALKNVKNDYTTSIGIYDSNLMNKLLVEKNIISEFKYAIRTKQFFMFLQPQISSESGKCVGAEALVRWYDIERGYRQPGEFIPVLEKSGLIYELDYYIWEKAAQQLQEWEKNGYEDMYISVNISPKDFYYADLYEVFTSLVRKYNVNPKKLNLEITESVIYGNDQIHKKCLQKLRDYGFNLEMDDFGSGYSSLNALKEMEMDVIKIDMEFLHQTENEERGRLIIQAIIRMAKNLGMKIVTEGVETQNQVDFLTAAGVDLFQGYFYSKPMAVFEFEHKYLEVLK